MKKHLAIALAALFSAACLAHAIAAAPTASLARLSGTDITNASGTLLVTIENPVNGGSVVSKIEINMLSFGTPTAASLEVTGTAIGTVTAGATTTVTFSAPLKPGMTALVTLSGVSNPALTGLKRVEVTAYDANNTAVILGTKAGLTLARAISSGSFRNVPYARVSVDSGTGAARTGLKVNNTLATYAYIVYNPYDSGSVINECTVDIPSAYAIVAATRIDMTNLSTGAGMSSIISNISNVTISAGIAKAVTIQLTNALNPGQIGVIFITNISNAIAAGSFQWRLTVRNTNSGAVAVAQDMPGFVNSQTVTLVTPAAGWFLDVQPWFEIGTGTGGKIAWPTRGSSNNTYRFSILVNGATVAVHSPVRISNMSFGLTAAGIARAQVNGAAGMFANPGVLSAQNTYTNSLAVGAAATNGYLVNITNIVNPSTAGTFIFSANYSNASPISFSSMSGYDATVTIYDNLFNASKTPAFGVIVAGSHDTNAQAKYYLVIANPMNSGDAIDTATITIPSGFSIVSTTAEVTAGITAANSGAVASATVGAGVITIAFTTPLGEGGTAYVPVTLRNPSAAGTSSFSATVSGLRDVSAVTASTSMPEEVSAGILSSPSVTIGGVITAAAQNVALTGYPNPLKTGNLTVSFTLQYASKVTAALFDVNNRRVATLLDGAAYAPGSSAIVWNGKSLSGADVKNGVYYVKVTAVPTGAGSEFSRTYKVVIQK